MNLSRDLHALNCTRILPNQGAFPSTFDGHTRTSHLYACRNALLSRNLCPFATSSHINTARSPLIRGPAAIHRHATCVPAIKGFPSAEDSL